MMNNFSKMMIRIWRDTDMYLGIAVETGYVLVVSAVGLIICLIVQVLVR